MTLTKSMIRGLMPALTTPFDKDGTIDARANQAQVEYVIAGGASALVPVGGTGEYSALSPSQRVQMVELTVAAARGRVPVIAGVLSPGFGDCVQAGRDLIRAGADGVMLLAPFYITPTQAGIRDYFKAYVDAIGGPVMLYEIPYRTGIALKPETIAQIADDGSAVGMKSSNPDMAAFARTLALAGDKMSIASGEEGLFPMAVAMGATGGVLATTDVLPRTWLEIFDLARAGDMKAALTKHARLAPFLAAVFSECNPGPLKVAQAMAGIPTGSVLLPLKPPSAETVKALETTLAPLLAYERALAKAAA
jgi:4-hydroxy-tetrahydrodipicolinate synthase